MVARTLAATLQFALLTSVWSLGTPVVLSSRPAISVPRCNVVAVQSWYDQGTRLTEDEPSPPPPSPPPKAKKAKKAKKSGGSTGGTPTAPPPAGFVWSPTF